MRVNQQGEIVGEVDNSAPFVQASEEPQPQERRLQIVDPAANTDPGTMKTWQKIMSEIAVIQRLEVNPAAHEIVRMIEAAKNIREMSDQLVEDMQEHRNKILKALGVEL